MLEKYIKQGARERKRNHVLCYEFFLLLELQFKGLLLPEVGARDHISFVVEDGMELYLSIKKRAKEIGKNEIRTSRCTYLWSVVLLLTISLWQIPCIFFAGGSLSVLTPCCLIVRCPAVRLYPMLRCLWLSESTHLTGLAAIYSLVSVPSNMSS